MSKSTHFFGQTVFGQLISVKSFIKTCYVVYQDDLGKIIRNLIKKINYF